MNKALIIVDVWDNHWDSNTKEMLSDLSNNINEFANMVRSNGDLVIHAPSMVMDQYEKRKIDKKYPYQLIQKNVLADRLKKLKFPLILDGKGQPNWKKQHPNIQIKNEDYVTTNGSEIYNLLKQNKIEKLYYCGAHANICMLWTRQFSILQMQHNKIDTMLIEDLSVSLPTEKYDSLLSFYNQHICQTILKNKIYG